MLRLEPLVRPLAALVAALALPAAAPAVAGAGFFPAEPVDGASAGVTGTPDVAVGRDGSGGVAYVRDGAVVVAPFVRGQFGAPQVFGPGAQPVLAAADGERLVVAWAAAGQVVAAVKPAGGAFGAPQVLGPGELPSAGLSIHGVAYVSWTSGGDVRVARLGRGESQFTVLGQPADLDPAATAGVGNGRSRIAVSAEGTAVVVFGEGDRVVGRRVFGQSVSAAPQVLNLPELEGRPGGAADLPEVDVEDDASYAWVTFRQAFTDGVQVKRRAIARRLVGSQFEAPAVVDGLAWGDGGTVLRAPSAISGRGEGLAAAATDRGLFGAILKDDRFFPARGLGGGVQAIPAVGVSEALDKHLVFLQSGPGEAGTVRARFYDDRADVRREPAPGEEVVLSRPELGAVDPAAGVDLAVNRAGDAVSVFVQGTGAERRLVSATFDRPPGAFVGYSSQAWRRAARPTLVWQPSFDLWGPLRYRVEVDGQPVAETEAARVAPAADVPDGEHRWRVVATDRRGQTAATPLRLLRIDTTAPRVTVRPSRRAGRVVRLTVRASDAPPTGTTVRTSGVAQVRVAWGDGTSTTVRRASATLTHRYTRGGRATLRVSATDRAGNATVDQRRITPRR